MEVDNLFTHCAQIENTIIVTECITIQRNDGSLISKRTSRRFSLKLDNPTNQTKVSTLQLTNKQEAEYQPINIKKFSKLQREVYNSITV